MAHDKRSANRTPLSRLFIKAPVHLSHVLASAWTCCRTLVLDMELGAAVLGSPPWIIAAIRIFVWCDGPAFAEADGIQPRGGETLSHQVFHDGFSALLGEPLVVRIGALGVGVAFDADVNRRPIAHDPDDLIEHRIGNW